MRLIDADALLRDIEHYHLSDGKFQHWVEIQPTIEPERKKGKWINHWIAPREDMLVFKCDQCGKISDGRHNFCPCCGADMRNQP